MVSQRPELKWGDDTAALPPQNQPEAEEPQGEEAGPARWRGATS